MSASRERWRRRAIANIAIVYSGPTGEISDLRALLLMVAFWSIPGSLFLVG